MGNKKSTLIDYLFITAKWRKLIIVNFLMVCFITAIFTLIMPQTFSATSTILPPSEDVDFGLSSLISSLPLAKFGLGAASEGSYTFIAILNSRTVLESIAKQFDLQELYQTDNMEETVKALRENVDVEINEDGTISLMASAQTGFLSDEAEKNSTRKLAADMANTFIAELDRVNTQLKTEKARNNRIFIEKRYLQNLTDLKGAEESMKTFQETRGIIALPEQIEVAIQAAAELNAQITVKEVEIGVLSQYVSGSHDQLERTKKELHELNKKLSEMKTGKNHDLTNGKSNGFDSNFLIPLADAPKLGMQYLRLFREVTLQQKILEFLLPQYEQAKIQEAKDTPTVQVLDAAVLPIKRSKPKRTILVLLAGFVSVAFSFIYVFLVEYIRDLENTKKEDYRKLEEVLLSIKSDIRKFIPFKKEKSVP